MLGHRELTMQDYAEILKRRFWLILAFAVLFLVIGVGVSHIIAPQYVSQTLVLVEQQQVPTSYVTPVVTQDLGERLASMREQILSRSRIQPIIERFNLSAGSMDDRVEQTQKAIGIKPIQSARGGVPGFYITFKASDPRTAQQVCGEITSLFISANLSAREHSAEGTTEFLKQQLADAKRNLDEQDAKLADFEQKNIGKLSGQTVQLGNGNLSVAMANPSQSTLQALTTQLDAKTQSLGRLQQNEIFLQAVITQQAEDARHIDSGTGISPDDRRAQLKALQAQKQELQNLYTPDHPDVAAISRKIADLKSEIAHAPTEPAPSSNAKHVDTPQLQQLRLQLRSVQQSITSEKQEQTRIQQQVRAIESKIEASPKVEEEYKQITRDHETAVEFYNTLLKKMNESSMATALEQRQQGEQFRVMDAPNLPEEPSFPNRRAFAGGGLLAGLVLGILFAGVLEYRDTTLRNERDIWAFTKLPTLAVIAHIEALSSPVATRSRWKFFIRTKDPTESSRG